MSKKDNIIITLRDDCIIIKDRINEKKYKIVLSGAEGIELKVGQITFGMRDGSMKVLPVSCGELMMEDILNEINTKRVSVIDQDHGIVLYDWR